MLFLAWDQVGSGTGAFRPPMGAAALCHTCSVAHRFYVLKCPASQLCINYVLELASRRFSNACSPRGPRAVTRVPTRTGRRALCNSGCGSLSRASRRKP